MVFPSQEESGRWQNMSRFPWNILAFNTLGKSSNRPPRNFDILVKLKLSAQFLYVKQKYCIIEVISQNFIMIYQFPEFVSQYKDRYPHSVKSEAKKHLNHLKVENIWKMQFSQQKSGLSNYTILQ